MEAPERIYLQTGLEEWDDDPELTWDDLKEVTWCVDRINDNDVEYVRRDIAVKLRDHLGIICAAFSSFGMEMPPEVAELWNETAWLELSPEAPLSPEGENEDADD